MDFTGVSGTLTATSISIKFTRLLSTSDSKDIAITDSSIFVLWAYSPVAGSTPTIYGAVFVTKEDGEGRIKGTWTLVIF